MDSARKKGRSHVQNKMVTRSRDERKGRDISRETTRWVNEMEFLWVNMKKRDWKNGMISVDVAGRR